MDMAGKLYCFVVLFRFCPFSVWKGHRDLNSESRTGNYFFYSIVPRNYPSKSCPDVSFNLIISPSSHIIRCFSLFKQINSSYTILLMLICINFLI